MTLGKKHDIIYDHYLHCFGSITLAGDFYNHPCLYARLYNNDGRVSTLAIYQDHNRFTTLKNIAQRQGPHALK